VSRLALTASFRVKPGHLDAFVRRVLQQRADCLAFEPGCSQFDVTVPAGGGDADGPDVVLYEVYADAAALEAHRRHAHYLAFKADTAGWIETSQSVVRVIVE
jgi:(4S)-4-hydroxy-5-phosphonooxypentane-2,3-dione isomerase